MALGIFGKVPGFYKNWKCHEDAFTILKGFVCTLALALLFPSLVLTLYHLNFQCANSVQASCGW